jgi:hypothetical protein
VERDVKHDAILVLFANPPLPGGENPRLAKQVGREGALALHRAFLLDSIELLHRASVGGVHRAIWLSERWEPDAEVAPKLEGFARGVQDGDLPGDRLCACLTQLLAMGYRRVAVVTTGDPVLPPYIVSRAFSTLRDRDVVIGPVRGGGIYLLGVRTLIPEMFQGIAWEGPRAVENAVRLLRIFGMAPVLLPERDPINTRDDLARLSGEIAAIEASGDPVPRWTAKAVGAVLGQSKIL